MTDTFTYTTQVLPRDIEPGDRIARLDPEMNLVPTTVREVLKVRRQGRTAYKVYLVEYDDLPDNRKPWAQYRHLTPFVLQPTQKVTVERVAVAPNQED